jgi:hypothetical protein
MKYKMEFVLNDALDGCEVIEKHKIVKYYFHSNNDDDAVEKGYYMCKENDYCLLGIYPANGVVSFSKDSIY